MFMRTVAMATRTPQYNDVNKRYSQSDQKTVTQITMQLLACACRVFNSSTALTSMTYNCSEYVYTYR